ncbi:hypothetical protein QTO34_006866 [Cnephaeus nilssonii]|uniref:Peptidase A2 domain-containing protein n=1 Tax=Cnephaeus nilssonii TaxID=3371016 RepID=A0AA40HJ65_CNENI|nr:hypothetical protein QTO34_006866 [Eptesicus nilssonii]
MVRMKIGGQTVDFMVDTGAEHSAVTQKIAPLSGKEVTIIGATGDQTRRPFYRPCQCQLGSHQVIHEFLYLPDCPVPLMGRDLLAKMGAEITFAPVGSAQLRLSEETFPTILSLAMPRNEEWRLYTPQTNASPLELELEKEFPLGWAEGNPPGLAKDYASVLTELKPETQPVKIRQYPIPMEAHLGIQVHLDWLLHGDLLNDAGLHGTHLSCLSKSLGLTTTTLSRIYRLQPLFAFEWENPTMGAKEQFIWTRLPQGFKNSPTLFTERKGEGQRARNIHKLPPAHPLPGMCPQPIPQTDALSTEPNRFRLSPTLFSGALASDLSKFPGQDLGCVLLQYVDDLLLASSTQAQCWEGTRALLRLLTETGYQVSKKKAQICQKEVKYLGFWITQGKGRLGTERKQAVCAIPVPSTRWQIREFLGVAGFCQIWIPGFSDLAKPLYEALGGEEKAPIDWGPRLRCCPRVGAKWRPTWSRDPPTRTSTGKAWPGDPRIEFRDPRIKFRDLRIKFRDLRIKFRDLRIKFRDPRIKFRDPRIKFRDLRIKFRDLRIKFRDPRIKFRDPRIKFRPRSPRTRRESDRSKRLRCCPAGRGSPEQEKAIITIKAKLKATPGLGLPDNSRVALGVLTQEFGTWQRPVAYLSKRIDLVASGWPLCLRVLAATALLVKEADKLTLGQNLNVKVPHAVVTLMEARGQQWLTHA